MTRMLRRLFRALRRRHPPASAPQSTPLLSVEEETELIDGLIRHCWEQGCWLPDSIAQHSLDASRQRALFAACQEHTPLHREAALAEQGGIPETLPQDPTPPDESIWIVTNQRCDLIKGLRDEPVVTLVRATRWSAQEAKERTRHSASLYIVRIGGEHAWVADFREMIVVPKTALSVYQVRQCLPDGDDARRRFALALAQRTWRRPVPLDIQERVHEPLARKHRSAGKHGPWARFFAAVLLILVDREDETGRLAVYAILGDDESDEEWVSHFFDETVLPLLKQDDGDWLDEDASRVIPADRLTMLEVFRTYKLDLDYVSLSRGGSMPEY